MSRLSLTSLNEANDLVVNTGASANDKNGDPLRTAFNKLKQSIDRAEANFVELYAGPGTNNFEIDGGGA